MKEILLKNCNDIWDFPGGSVAGQLPCSAGHTGSVHSQGAKPTHDMTGGS